MKTFFFDTYAFFEIIEGNAEYKPYTNEVAVVTTRMNLMELYYGLFAKFNIQAAERWYNRLTKFCVKLDDDTIKEAMIFRVLNKKRKLSYIDCIGYTLARNRSIPFLTGDEHFKHLEGVEFVK